jgi:hypothetical protein
MASSNRLSHPLELPGVSIAAHLHSHPGRFTAVVLPQCNTVFLGKLDQMLATRLEQPTIGRMLHRLGLDVRVQSRESAAGCFGPIKNPGIIFKKTAAIISKACRFRYLNLPVEPHVYWVLWVIQHQLSMPRPAKNCANGLPHGVAHASCRTPSSQRTTIRWSTCTAPRIHLGKRLQQGR